jgi:predicted PurR-regulated permease PerM
MIQALIVSVSAWFCNIGDFTLIFIFTFICSFIPVIGASPMAFMLAIYAYLDNRMGVSITMIIVGIISSVSDNLLRPYLVSRGDISVPTIVSFLSIIGGVIVLGISGLFIGPLLAALFFGVLPIITEEYFSKE